MKTNKGYVNEGKVLLGLHYCSFGKCQSGVVSCPYYKRGCARRLAFETSRYILELERRLIEYEEKEHKY